MPCCSPDAYRSIFGAKTVERDARRYRKKGLTSSARWILERLTDDGVAGQSVLEIGGGVGGLQIELVEAGASSATNVEIIDSYEDAARRLIAEHRVDDRISRRIDDFAQGAVDVGPADIVVMHRVLCCYPDPDSLMGVACEHSRRRVAITLPRDTWWTKLTFASMNAWLRVRRVAFRGYVHSIQGLHEVAARRGFHAVDQHAGMFWTSIVLACAEPDRSD